jgi:hypothetical protein
MIDGYGIFPRFFLAVSVYGTWMKVSLAVHRD